MFFHKEESEARHTASSGTSSHPFRLYFLTWNLQIQDTGGGNKTGGDGNKKENKRPSKA